ncbi:MAG: Rieske 2Fe-2S domain-containing protein [Rhodocyclaceae bacterium]|nr:Rieske 2Fe-2S domain-containing protein [Rhodocyclaceae bacterium]MBX3668329.1 Rieske 2Fe-2S domain-containing protein [Rhodocyclaceae bacterium]
MFSRAASCDELWDGEMRHCLIGEVPVLLLRLGESIYAYRDRCAHLGTPLSTGCLAEGRIVCPSHHWEYDARSGAGINPRNARLERFAVRVEAGVVLVDTSGAAHG